MRWRCCRDAILFSEGGAAARMQPRYVMKRQSTKTRCAIAAPRSHAPRDAAQQAGQVQTSATVHTAAQTVRGADGATRCATRSRQPRCFKPAPDDQPASMRVSAKRSADVDFADAIAAVQTGAALRRKISFCAMHRYFGVADAPQRYAAAAYGKSAFCLRSVDFEKRRHGIARCGYCCRCAPPQERRSVLMARGSAPKQRVLQRREQREAPARAYNTRRCRCLQTVCLPAIRPRLNTAWRVIRALGALASHTVHNVTR